MSASPTSRSSIAAGKGYPAGNDAVAAAAAVAAVATTTTTAVAAAAAAAAAAADDGVLGATGGVARRAAAAVVPDATGRQCNGEAHLELAGKPFIINQPLHANSCIPNPKSYIINPKPCPLKPIP